jgi:hypothetical protein
MPVIPAAQEAEIRKIAVRSQPGQIVHKTLSQKNPSQNKKAGGVAQGVGPEFKSQYHKKKSEFLELLEQPIVLSLSLSYMYIHTHTYSCICKHVVYTYTYMCVHF